MKKKKYHNQNKLLLLKIFLSLFILFIFLNIIIPNRSFTIIFGILGIISGFIVIILFSVTNLGVPNNSFKEFNVSKDIFFEKEICLKEIKKGIWECNFKNRTYIIDMKKWHNQINKIYTLLFFILYIEKYNNKELTTRGLFKKIKINNLEDCSIVFVKHGGVIKKKTFVKNGILKRNTFIQFKLLHSIPMNGNWIDWKHLLTFKQQDISSYYIFNK